MCLWGPWAVCLLLYKYVYTSIYLNNKKESAHMYDWPGKIIFGNSQTISYQTEWIRFLARSFLHSTKYKKVMNDLFDILNEVESSGIFIHTGRAVCQFINGFLFLRHAQKLKKCVPSQVYKIIVVETKPLKNIFLSVSPSLLLRDSSQPHKHAIGFFTS